MNLSKEEFCIFNTKSKIKLLQKDGKLLRQRKARDNIIFSLFKIYQFYVEIALDVPDMKTLAASPVMNADVAKLYPP